MTNTESPRLAVTPGEWYTSDMLATMSTDLRQMNEIPEVIGAMNDYRTVWGFSQIDSAAVDYGAVELEDLIFRRTSFPPDEFSAGRDGDYMKYCRTVWGFPQIDSAAVDCGAVELDDLIFRRMSFPPDDLSTGRDGDYIWLALLTGLSVRTRSVTGSLRFGSPHRLVCSCFCSTIISLCWIESVDVSQGRHCRTPDNCYSRRTLCIGGYLIIPSVIVILIICCCFGIFRVRDMASDGLHDREQAGSSYAPSGPLPGTFLGPALDIRSEKFYDLAPDIPDVSGLASC